MPDPSTGQFINMIPTKIVNNTPPGEFGSVEDFDVPFFSILTRRRFDGAAEGIPAGTLVENATWRLLNSGVIVPLTATVVTDLDDAMQVPRNLVTPSGAMTIDWNFDFLPAEQHQGYFVMLTGFAPAGLIVPSPSTCAVIVPVLAGMYCRRRR
jgi:hypothetical protein